jgi:hypothetical protein
MTRQERDTQNFNNLKACLKFIKNNGSLFTRLDKYSAHFNLSVAYLNQAYKQKYIVYSNKSYRVKATISDEEIRGIVKETKSYLRASKHRSRARLATTPVIEKQNFMQRLLSKIYAIFKNKK